MIPPRRSPACWHRDAARAHRLQQARHAQARGAVELQRIDEVGVDAAQDDVGALEARDGAHIDAAVAHDQVVALDQQEAEIARQVRLLEIGLAEGPGRQQADARIAALGRAAPGPCADASKNGARRSTFMAL